MNGVLTPWLVEVLLISYRAWRKRSRPPLPGELAATFVVFGSLSLIPNKQVGAVTGWGFVIASALNILPDVVVPQYKVTPASQVAAGSPATNVIVTPGKISAGSTDKNPNTTTVVVPGVGTFQFPQG